jgi:hypothetical protein
VKHEYSQPLEETYEIKVKVKYEVKESKEQQKSFYNDNTRNTKRMRMPVKQNSCTNLKVLLVLTDRGINSTGE